MRCRKSGKAGTSLFTKTISKTLDRREQESDNGHGVEVSDLRQIKVRFRGNRSRVAT
jgi:hypothetical protein